MSLTQKQKVAGAILAAFFVMRAIYCHRRRYLPPCDSRLLLHIWGPCWVKLRHRDGFHTGIDFAVNHGDEVRAAMAGIIEFAGHDKERNDRSSGGGYGILVDIRHEDGSLTRYAHLMGYKKGIAVGDSVEAGQIIGFAGASGHTKSRPRLHFEIRTPEGLHQDPMDLIRW